MPAFPSLAAKPWQLLRDRMFQLWTWPTNGNGPNYQCPTPNSTTRFSGQITGYIKTSDVAPDSYQICVWKIDFTVKTTTASTIPVNGTTLPTAQAPTNQDAAFGSPVLTVVDLGSGVLQWTINAFTATNGVQGYMVFDIDVTTNQALT